MGADEFYADMSYRNRYPHITQVDWDNIKKEALEKTNNTEEYGDYIDKALDDFERRYYESKREIEANINDSVNHPNHYCTGKYECMDIMKEVFGEEAFKNYCYLNAFKYIWRSPRKNGTEDLKKAIFYLNKYIELSDKNN